MRQRQHIHCHLVLAGQCGRDGVGGVMSKEAMKLALEALDIVNPKEFAQADPDGKIDKAITALRLEIDALNMASTAAKPDFWEGYVPEPVKPATEESSATQAQQALDKKAENARELGLDYEPAQRTWVDLTDEEIRILAGSLGYGPYVREVVRAAEARLKEKNT